MRVPTPGTVPDAALLNTVAEQSPEWPHGSVRLRAAARIGVDYGLSDGVVYRVEAETEDGPVSFVLKHESAQAVARALLFHRAVGPSLVGSIPALLGGAVDDGGEAGVLLLEDVAPARQGDALLGCTDAEAEAAVRTLARAHAITWGRAGPELPRWVVRSLAPGDWAWRLTAAAENFPDIVTAEVVDELAGVPARVESAIAALDAGESAWIHEDAHLDNVLFRPDGSAVLLDWSGAAVGPPAVDLARLLTEGPNAGAREELAAGLLDAYADELQRGGIDVGVGALRPGVSDALVLLVQTAVGWAARVTDRGARMGALQENLLRSALAWRV